MTLQNIYYVVEMVVGLAAMLSIVLVGIGWRHDAYMLKKSMADRREERS